MANEPLEPIASAPAQLCVMQPTAREELAPMTADEIIWLLKSLEDQRYERWSDRMSAADKLGNLGDARAVEPLIKALGDKSTSVQSRAAKSLGQLGDPRAVEPLIKLLKSIETAVRHEAVKALGQLGDVRSIKPLINMIGDKEGYVQSAAAEALYKLGDICAVEPLIKAVSSWNTDTRRAAAEALGKLGDARAVEPLIKALGDEMNSVQCAAAVALDMIGDARAVEPLIKAVSSGNADTRCAAVKALGKLGDTRAIESIIKTLGEFNAKVRNSASEALAKLGHPKWKEWVTGREDDFKRLGSSGDAQAVELLIGALESQDKWKHEKEREAVADALGEAGDVRAVEPLIRVLKDETFSWGDDNDTGVPCAIARALGRIGDTRAVEPLIKVLSDFRLRRIKRAVAVALGQLADTRAVEPLIQVIGDKPGWECDTAVEALGHLGDKRAVEPLISLLETADVNVDESVQGSAAKALGILGDSRAVGPLIKALEIKRGKVKSAAAGALAKLHVIQMVEPLIRMLLYNLDKDMRFAAAAALGELGDARAIEPLFKALVDWHAAVRLVAAKALSKFGRPEWKERIKGSDDDFKWLEGSNAARTVEQSAAIQTVSKNKFLPARLFRFLDRRQCKHHFCGSSLRIDSENIVIGEGYARRYERNYTYSNKMICSLCGIQADLQNASKLSALLLDSLVCVPLNTARPRHLKDVPTLLNRDDAVRQVSEPLETFARRGNLKMFMFHLTNLKIVWDSQDADWESENEIQKVLTENGVGYLYSHKFFFNDG